MAKMKASAFIINALSLFPETLCEYTSGGDFGGKDYAV